MDTKRLSIEAVVRKAIRDVQDDPRRGLRNLIDMGESFAKGRFQKPFLQRIQTMLEKEDSAYYTLLIRTLENTDITSIYDFCINIGYNSCTKGAKLIRALEEKHHFNIPWSLSLEINEHYLAQGTLYPRILEQGMELGIFTYLLYLSKCDPALLLPLVKRCPDCAFVVLVREREPDDTLLSLMACGNVLISAYDDEFGQLTCQFLQAHRFPCAMHLRYGKADIPRILNDSWVRHAVAAAPLFAFLSPSPDVEEKDQLRVYDHLRQTREQQRYPLLLLDLKHDQLTIDRIISDDECIIGFDEEGWLITHRLRAIGNEDLNILHHDLISILDHEQNRYGQ